MNWETNELILTIDNNELLYHQALAIDDVERMKEFGEYVNANYSYITNEHKINWTQVTEYFNDE